MGKIKLGMRNLLNSPSLSFSLTYAFYALFTVLHLYANYQAVRAVCMETLNRARLHLVWQHYLKWEEVPSPAVINPQEPLLLGI